MHSNSLAAVVSLQIGPHKYEAAKLAEPGVSSFSIVVMQ